MLFKFAALLLLAVLVFADDAVPARTVVKLPGKGKARSCKTACVIDRDPGNSQVSPNTPCVTIEDPYDFHLDIGTWRISAHLNTLAAVIPYFNDRTSQEDNVSGIIKQDLEPSAVKSLLMYAYTRKMTVREQNAEALLKAALFFQMNNVVKKCIAFLQSRNNIQHIINILLELSIEPDEHILNCFGDWSKPDQFLELSSDVFLKILRSNKIQNVSEENVFDVSYRWIQHKPAERSAFTYAIMENVRFPLMTSNYLFQNVTSKLWTTNTTRVHDLIADAISYKLQPGFEPNFRLGCSIWPRSGAHKFVALHWYTSPIAMQMYDPTVDTFQYLPKGPYKDDYCVVVHHCNIYAIGGDYTNDVKVFNLKQNSWKTIEPMIDRRAYASAAAANGYIYVSGGYYSTVLSTFESYDTLTNEWSKLPNMSQKRNRHRLIAYENNLYAIGGQDDHYNNLRHVEKYDILTKEWANVSPMLNARYYFGAALLNRKIYVCGGYETNVGDLAEVFDIVQQKWTAITNMCKKRSFFSLVAIQDKLWAFKGSNPSTEVYDPKTNAWSEMPNKFDHDNLVWETVMINF